MRSETGSMRDPASSRRDSSQPNIRLGNSQPNVRPGSPSLDPRKRRRTFDGRPNSPLSDIDADPSRETTPTRKSRGSIVSWFSSPKSNWKHLDDPYTPSKPKRKSTLERLAKLRAIVSPPGSRPSTPGENDDSEEEEPDPEIQARKIRTSINQLRALTKDFESKRTRAFTYCGTVQHPDPDGKTAEGRWLRWQRRLGILELRVRIHIRQITIEEEPPYYKDVYAIVKSIKFEMFFGLLIVLNAICIGWDTFYDVDERRPFILDYSEHFFTAMFLIEYIMRIMAFTCFWHLSFMNLFDTFLIWGTGVLLTWVLLPVGLRLAPARRLAALRILRLARLCKVIRIMRAFKELWMLVQGVLECTTLLIWAIVIGGMVHFAFAVAVVELVAKADEFKEDRDVQYYFGSTIRSMFSLFQIMTFDSWSGIVRPITTRSPQTVLLFGIFMGLTGIVLFNLMTAIVVRNAYDAGERDNEAVAMAKAQDAFKLRLELLETFKELDEDGSGALSQEEFNDCLDDYLFVRKMKMLDIDLEELPDFFEILDDGDGEVDQQEFIGGMMKMQGSARSCDMLRATTLLKQQNIRFTDLQHVFVREALETYTRMEGDVDRLHTGMNDVMHLTAEVMKKLDSLGVRQIMKSTLGGGAAPFIEEPEIRDITKADKKFASAKKHGKEIVIANDIETLLPPEAKLEKVVPPSWIIREGRSFGAKNPGWLKLQRDPSLKEKIKEKNIRDKKAAKKPTSAMGVHRELGHSWNTLEVTREDASLRITASETEIIPPSQMQLTPLVNHMAQDLVPTVPLSPVIKVEQAPSEVSELALTPSMQSQLPDEESRKSLQHPNAIMEDTLL